MVWWMLAWFNPLPAGSTISSRGKRESDGKKEKAASISKNRLKSPTKRPFSEWVARIPGKSARNPSGLDGNRDLRAAFTSCPRVRERAWSGLAESQVVEIEVFGD
jgi:hypothetical protein